LKFAFVRKTFLFKTNKVINFRRYGIEIKDFGKSWRDGLAFNAMVHTIRPDLVDMEQVKKQSARVNLENAFSTAENHLGIARLIDPEGKLLLSRL
jgi:nesprin-1